MWKKNIPQNERFNSKFYRIHSAKKIWLFAFLKCESYTTSTKYKHWKEKPLDTRFTHFSLKKYSKKQNIIKALFSIIQTISDTMDRKCSRPGKVEKQAHKNHMTGSKVENSTKEKQCQVF